MKREGEWERERARWTEGERGMDRLREREKGRGRGGEKSWREEEKEGGETDFYI